MKGFHYEKFSNYVEITDYLTDSGLDVHELGLSSGGDMIYGLSIGDLSKPMLVADGTIHGGHEWRCTHWVAEFGKRLLTPTLDTNYRAIENLKLDYCIMLVPCLNTWGYLNNDYRNANGVNLNRNFPIGWHTTTVVGSDVPGHSQYKGPAPMSEPESQALASIFENYNVVGHISTHTSGGYYGYTIENASTMQDSRKIIVEDFFESMKLNFPGVWPWNANQTATYGPMAHRSEPRSSWNTEWAGQMDNGLGGKSFSLLFETGSLETVEMGAEIGMTGLLLAFLHISKWRETGRLINHN